MHESVLHLAVQSGRDPLRRERLTRDLYDALVADERLRGLRVEPLQADSSVEGSKGSIEAVIALLVAGAPYAQPAADALTAALQSWCGRDRRATLRITDGDRSIDVVGDPSPEQQALLERFFSEGDGKG